LKCSDNIPQGELGIFPLVIGVLLHLMRSFGVELGYEDEDCWSWFCVAAFAVGGAANVVYEVE